MSRGFFKVTAKGNVGTDIDVNHLPSGDLVINFSMAASEYYKDANGNRVERTEWFKITAYRKTAELINEMVQKGTELYLEGKLVNSKWQDQQGNDRKATEIIATSFDVLRRGKERPMADAQPQDQHRQPQGQYQSAPQNNGYMQPPARTSQQNNHSYSNNY